MPAFGPPTTNSTGPSEGDLNVPSSISPNDNAWFLKCSAFREEIDAAPEHTPELRIKISEFFLREMCEVFDYGILAGPNRLFTVEKYRATLKKVEVLISISDMTRPEGERLSEGNLTIEAAQLLESRYIKRGLDREIEDRSHRPVLVLADRFEVAGLQREKGHFYLARALASGTESDFLLAIDDFAMGFKLARDEYSRDKFAAPSSALLRLFKPHIDTSWVREYFNAKGSLSYAEIIALFDKVLSPLIASIPRDPSDPRVDLLQSAARSVTEVMVSALEPLPPSQETRALAAKVNQLIAFERPEVMQQISIRALDSLLTIQVGSLPPSENFPDSPTPTDLIQFLNTNFPLNARGPLDEMFFSNLPPNKRRLLDEI